jgi:hypothetical protein
MTGKLLAEAAQDSAPDAAVTIVEHPKGFLLRLEHAGASMTLDRAEAFNLHEKLSAKLGGMPTQL